jgi:hypothetical protein
VSRPLARHPSPRRPQHHVAGAPFTWHISGCPRRDLVRPRSPSSR